MKHRKTTNRYKYKMLKALKKYYHWKSRIRNMTPTQNSLHSFSYVQLNVDMNYRCYKIFNENKIRIHKYVITVQDKKKAVSNDIIKQYKI